MDGPRIFAAVLDRDAGRFRIGPADVTVPAARRYLSGTMVLEATRDTPTAWAVVRDVLLIGPWRDDSRRSATQRRAPTDNQAEKVLLRTIRCLNGSIDFLLECEPAFDYGRQRGLWRRASALCEKLLSFATLHLYAEEIDPHTGGHLGNFPQAFSHLAMINAVMHLIRADEEISRDGRFQAGHQLTVDGSDVRL
jgi:GH15 family glucan-1,4-alpha-glucosidase